MSTNLEVKMFSGIADSYLKMLTSLKTFLAIQISMKAFLIRLIATNCPEYLSCAKTTSPYEPFPNLFFIIYFSKTGSNPL